MVLISSKQVTVQANNGTSNGYRFTQNVYYGDYDVSLNKTPITIEIYAIGINASYSSFSSPKLDVSLYNNKTGTTIKVVDNVTVKSIPKTNTLIGSYNDSIEHKDDGNLTIAVSMSYNNNSSTSYLPKNASISSGDLPLPTIPRKSTITATNADIGSNSIITISKKSSAFTNTLKYSTDNGANKTTIVNKRSDICYAWTIPTDFYELIPNSPTGKVKIYCETFNGDTSLGENEFEIIYTANQESSKPTITPVMSDLNTTITALTNKIVRYMSNVRITPTVAPRNSATITSVTINNVSMTGDYVDFNGSSYTSYEIVAIDSRDYPTTYTYQSSNSSAAGYFELIDYIPLTMNLAPARPTRTGDTLKIIADGNYYNGNIGTTPNVLTITWKVMVQGGSWTDGVTALTPTIANNKYSIDQLVDNPLDPNGDWDYQKIYYFQLHYSDILDSHDSSLGTVTKGIPNVAYHKNGILVNGIEKTHGDITTNTEEVKCGYQMYNMDVYVKRIDIGVLPVNSPKYIALSTAGLVYNEIVIIDLKGMAYSTGATIPLPYAHTNTAYNINLCVTQLNGIEINTGTNRSGYNGFVDIYYLKL